MGKPFNARVGGPSASRLNSSSIVVFPYPMPLETIGAHTLEVRGSSYSISRSTTRLLRLGNSGCSLGTQLRVTTGDGRGHSFSVRSTYDRNVRLEPRSVFRCSQPWSPLRANCISDRRPTHRPIRICNLAIGFCRGSRVECHRTFFNSANLVVLFAICTRTSCFFQPVRAGNVHCSQ